MEMHSSVRNLNIKNTISSLTPLNHVKSRNLYINRASSYVSFRAHGNNFSYASCRAHRSPIWKASVKENNNSGESEDSNSGGESENNSSGESENDNSGESENSNSGEWENSNSHESELKGMISDADYSSLTALCPLDGRYWAKVKDLAPFMSEFALIKFRVLVEIRWLLKLSQISEVPEVPRFSKEAESYLQDLADKFNKDDAVEVKKIEEVTNHDVKAVEYFLKQRCQSHPEISKVLEFFHFGCTSEDINNLAYALMLKQALNKVILPAMDKLITAIRTMATANASISMASHTHGQLASPTTLGKEMANFANRLSSERMKLSQIKILGKFAGAVGNYSALLVAYPDVNWPKIAEEFVTSLGIPSFNPCTTQIEPHDYKAGLFNSMSQFNVVLVDFDIDIWLYISRGYFKQITKAGEIGSSTMPHKVNPIDFENSEGNCGIAIGIFKHLSTKLPNSREQRDLTDSTVLRNIGVPLGHSLLAYKSALQGIAKLQVNEAALIAELDNAWEVLAEAIQTVMRKCGVPEPYEKLKKLTRGKKMTREIIRKFIEDLDIPIADKKSLLNLTPHSYVGLAVELAKKYSQEI